MCVDSWAAFYSIRKEREQGNVGKAGRAPFESVVISERIPVGVSAAVTGASVMTAPLGWVTTPEMLPVIPAQAGGGPKTIATISAGTPLERNRIHLHL